MKRLCLTFFLITCCSCIPAYLPAYTKIKPDTPLLEGSLERLIKKETIIIIKNFESPNSNSLGHQYLFGIIPFTSIYLTEPADSLALNVLEDILSSLGYNPIICTLDELDEIPSSTKISLIVQGKIKNLSVSGFDALFFRYLSISGSLELESYKNIKSFKEYQPYQQENYSLDRSKFKLTAHLSELNFLLEKSLRDAIIKFATKM